jgi:hypothetical protein
MTRLRAAERPVPASGNRRLGLRVDPRADRAGGTVRATGKTCFRTFVRAGRPHGGYGHNDKKDNHGERGLHPSDYGARIHNAGW